MKTDNPQDHEHSDYENRMNWLTIWLCAVTVVLAFVAAATLGGVNRRLDQHRDYLCLTAPQPELLDDCKNYRLRSRTLTLEDRIRELERLLAEKDTPSSR